MRTNKSPGVDSEKTKLTKGSETRAGQSGGYPKKRRVDAYQDPHLPTPSFNIKEESGGAPALDKPESYASASPFVFSQPSRKKDYVTSEGLAEVRKSQEKSLTSIISVDPIRSISFESLAQKNFEHHLPYLVASDVDLSRLSRSTFFQHGVVQGTTMDGGLVSGYMAIKYCGRELSDSGASIFAGKKKELDRFVSRPLKIYSLVEDDEKITQVATRDQVISGIANGNCLSRFLRVNYLGESSLENPEHSLVVAAMLYAGTYGTANPPAARAVVLGVESKERADKYYDVAALMFSIEQRDVSLLEALVRLGVDPDKINEEGYSARELCLYEGHTKALEILNRFSESPSARETK